MSDTIHIAVFGDTHGHLRLMLQLCRLWQMNSGVHLDGVLQCGDFGYFPDVSRIDKSTRAYAKRDPEELGFAEYFALDAKADDPLVESILCGSQDDLGTVTGPIIFCHGNHEDFELLDAATSSGELCPVDRYERFLYLRSGHSTDLCGLKVAALGGGPEGNDPHTASRIVGPHVSSSAAKTLRAESFDILLCHCAPSGIGGESDKWGSDLLRKVVQKAQPRYCFYAHHRDEVPAAQIGATECVWHNDVNFERLSSNQNLGQVERKCMSILKIDRDDSCEHVDASWFNAVTGTNWQYF